MTSEGNGRNGSAGNGRDHRGRFLHGTAGGPGNLHARAVHELRSELFATIGTEDVRAVVAKLVERARAGDIPAAREVLDRTLGKAGIGLDLSEDQLLSKGAAQALAVAIVDATRARLGSLVADELMEDLLHVIDRAG